MYRIAICDDEMFFIENLKKLIPDCYQVDVFTSGKELLKSRVEEYHIFLLDIEMPEMRGFEVAEQLNRMLAEPLIIFITGFEQLVFESFDYRPFNFMRKHYMDVEFEKKFQLAIEELDKRSRRCIISTGEMTYGFLLCKALYAEVLRHKVTIYMDEGYKDIVLRIPMKEVMKQLEGYGFVQIHRSYAVNLARVVLIDEGTVLNNRVRLPLGRKYKGEIKKKYMDYLL